MRSDEDKLERRSQRRPTKTGAHLEEMEAAVLDRQEWRRSLVKCVHVD